jgi:hypothetical protein
MPVQVRKLPDEPIIILTYEGDVDAETIKSAFRQSVELMASIEGVVYRISDVRAIDVDEQAMRELFKLVADIRNQQTGSSADPRIHGVFVGEHQLARLYAEIMSQYWFGSTQIPFYHTLDEALEHIRFTIRDRSNI